MCVVVGGGGKVFSACCVFKTTMLILCFLTCSKSCFVCTGFLSIEIECSEVDKFIFTLTVRWDQSEVSANFDTSNSFLILVGHCIT